jgi:hypothetical protein
MPDIDYVLLADYVRQDAGTIHIMGAGIDTFWISEAALPAAVPVNLAARISFSGLELEDVGALHRLSFVVQGPDGPVLSIAQSIETPRRPDGVPEHWRIGVGFALRFPVLIARYGDYSLDFTVDDDPGLTKSLDVRVVQAAPQG